MKIIFLLVLIVFAFGTAGYMYRVPLRTRLMHLFHEKQEPALNEAAKHAGNKTGEECCTI